MNEPRKYFNQSQPQTLQIGVMLLYINAAFKLLWLSPIGLALAAAMGFGGYGIANEERWGYQLGVAGALINLLITITLGGFSNALIMLGMIFDLALVALLLHPHSREYQKIWFH